MTNKSPQPASEIGMVGLGVRGRNLVLNMADHGFAVAGYDQDRSMPAHFSVIAVGRADLSDEKLRRRLHDGVKKFSRQGMVKTAEWGEFARHIRYQQGDFKKLQTYTALGEQCAKLEKE